MKTSLDLSLSTLPIAKTYPGHWQGSRRWAECAAPGAAAADSRPRRCGAGTQGPCGPLSESPTASQWLARRARRSDQTWLSTLLITSRAARRFPTTQPLPSLSSHLSSPCTPGYNSICSRTGLCPLAPSLPLTVLAAGRRTDAETSPCCRTSPRAGAAGSAGISATKEGTPPPLTPPTNSEASHPPLSACSLIKALSIGRMASRLTNGRLRCYSPASEFCHGSVQLSGRCEMTGC